VRAWSEHGMVRPLALLEIALSSVLIAAALVYVRASQSARLSS